MSISVVTAANNRTPSTNNACVWHTEFRSQPGKLLIWDAAGSMSEPHAYIANIIIAVSFRVIRNATSTRFGYWMSLEHIPEALLRASFLVMFRTWMMAYIQHQKRNTSNFLHLHVYILSCVFHWWQQHQSHMPMSHMPMCHIWFASVFSTFNRWKLKRNERKANMFSMHRSGVAAAIYPWWFPHIFSFVDSSQKLSTEICIRAYCNKQPKSVYADASSCSRTDAQSCNFLRFIKSVET